MSTGSAPETVTDPPRPADAEPPGESACAASPELVYAFNSFYADLLACLRECLSSDEDAVARKSLKKRYSKLSRSEAAHIAEFDESARACALYESLFADPDDGVEALGDCAGEFLPARGVTLRRAADGAGASGPLRAKLMSLVRTCALFARMRGLSPAPDASVVRMAASYVALAGCNVGGVPEELGLIGLEKELECVRASSARVSGGDLSAGFQGSSLVALATEIAGSLTGDDIKALGERRLVDFMSDSGQGGILSRITDKIQEKLASGAIDETDFARDAGRFLQAAFGARGSGDALSAMMAGLARR